MFSIYVDKILYQYHAASKPNSKLARNFKKIFADAAPYGLIYRDTWLGALTIRPYAVRLSVLQNPVRPI